MQSNWIYFFMDKDNVCNKYQYATTPSYGLLLLNGIFGILILSINCFSKTIGKVQQSQEWEPPMETLTWS